jgi:hypothetical protein
MQLGTLVSAPPPTRRWLAQLGHTPHCGFLLLGEPAVQLQHWRARHVLLAAHVIRLQLCQRALQVTIRCWAAGLVWYVALLLLVSEL